MRAERIRRKHIIPLYEDLFPMFIILYRARKSRFVYSNSSRKSRFHQEICPAGCAVHKAFPFILFFSTNFRKSVLCQDFCDWLADVIKQYVVLEIFL